MNNNFNELYPTITNLRSGVLEIPNCSQNIFEEERYKAAMNYKCSLIDIPEIGDQTSFLAYLKNNNDETLRTDFFKKQRNSVINFSNNSIFNLDSVYGKINPVFKSPFYEQQEVQPQTNSEEQFKNLWVSKKNIFENEGPNEIYLPQKFVPLKEIKHQEKSENKKKERVACHCKKSKCLRLYCECFAKGLICGVDCICEGCHNTNDLKELRELVVQETLEKNPFAFKSKYKNIDEDKDKKLLHSRGCNCSKTGCIKKYCECFNAGTGCSRLCKCSNCKNENIELKDSDVKVYYDRVLRKRSKKSILNQCFENKKNLFSRVKQI